MSQLHLVSTSLPKDLWTYVASSRFNPVLYSHTKMASSSASFLGIEGYHAFVTGAAGGVGVAVVRELLGRIMQAH